MSHNTVCKGTPLRKIAVCILTFLISMQFGCAIFGGGSEIQRAKNYSISPPARWQSKNTSGESDEAFTLPSGNVVTITSSCKGEEKTSLEVKTKHLLLGARQINFEKQTRIEVAKTEGLHSVLTAAYDGKPFHLEIFVLPKNSCVFDFTLLSPKTIPKTDSEDFMAFLKTFTYGTN